MRSTLNTPLKMAAEVEEARPSRWYFSKEKLSNSPSRADGVDPEKELRYRQDAASLIQEMGPRLGLNPLCVSTAIVYMHRFYMINSFKAFDRGIIATAALFLAAKVEELPKKLEFVAKCSYCLLHRDAPPLDVNSEAYNKIVDDITFHELTILQTLGFDVQVKHPHPHVVECMNLVGVSKDLSQAAFFLAHNSQLLTTFCLQYPPTVVACMCIHLTCVWKGLEIPRSNDNKNWWEYVDKKVTQSKLEELAKEFLTIVEKSPTRLRKRIQENFKMAVEGSRGSSGSHGSGGSHGNKQLSRPKDYHMLHPSSSTSSKPHPSHHHPRPGSKPHPPSHQQHHKTHQSSPPPPPPPSHSTTHNSHLINHRKHKDHHHEVPPPGSVGPSHKPEKHSLTDPNYAAQKSKRIKTDDAQQIQQKQHMSLKDYRQSKRQQQYQQLKSAPTKMKPLDHSSKSHSNLPSLPPMANSHSFQSKPPLSSRTHSNHSSLPPLPPPLPSHNSPPPPPPPYSSQ